LIVYLFYVETKGPTLEEIARIFDGDDAIAHVDLQQVEKDIHVQENEHDVTSAAMASEKTAA
jgi:hypothetical protein